MAGFEWGGLAIQIVSGILIVAGAGFFLIGAFGFLRMPDLFTRIHAASLADTTGMALVLLGLALLAGPSFAAAKLICLVLFLLFMGPAATHALAAAALASGLKPLHEASGKPGAKQKNSVAAKTRKGRR